MRIAWRTVGAILARVSADIDAQECRSPNFWNSHRAHVARPHWRSGALGATCGDKSQDLVASTQPSEN